LAALESGSGGAISAVHFGNLNVTAGEPARSIQPATNPPGASFESSEGGEEYFVSALDPAHTVDNRVSVWALTNTSSLSSTPDVHLSNIIVDTEGYGFPPAVDQQSGQTPLRDFLASLGFKNHEELVAANDDHMQQVVFADGKLWTAVPTNQGYVSIQSPKQNSVLFPAVSVTSTGKAAIVFSVVGEDFLPSAAYATLDAATGAGPIVITGPGFAPDDGFSGYAPFSASRVARWGDYSAAVADEDGNLWLATESINPPLPPETQLPPGVLAANFGTFITEVKP
jgi:catechol 2,3-dioxygenase-like lactoylglutathione lyase family enzyme